MHVDDDVARFIEVGGKLERVVHHIDQTLTQAEEITRVCHAEQTRVDQYVHVSGVVLTLRDAQRLIEELFDGEDVGGQLQTVTARDFGAFSVKLGIVQDLVDQAEEGLGGGERVLYEAVGDVGQFAGFDGERVETDDRVERHAQFVRNVKEEIALHLRQTLDVRHLFVAHGVENANVPGGEQQTVRRLGDHVATQKPLVFGARVDVAELLGDEDGGERHPAHRFRDGEDDETGAIALGEFIHEHFPKHTDALADDVHEARHGEGKQEPARRSVHLVHQYP